MTDSSSHHSEHEAPIFAGLRVIDCASFVAAPAAATVFSDFGADVIKIEPPGTGDPYRNLGRLPGMPTSEHDYAWLLTGRNKRSLALDLKSKEGQAVLHRLAAQADIFITNYPRNVRHRLGLAAKDLTPLNPRLIYAAFSAYGETGHEAEKSGFDSTAWWARSGLMDIVRADSTLPPARSVPGMGDHPSAMGLFGAIVTALYRRERTGKGGVVHSSLLANGLWANGIFAQARFCEATIPPRVARTQAPNAVTNMYRTRDGRWFMLSMLNEERQFRPFCAALGLPGLPDDPRFAAIPSRRANAAALIATLDDAFAQRDLAELMEVMHAAGVTFGVVHTVDEIPHDRQARAIGAVVPFEASDMLTVMSPFQIEGAPRTTPRKAPALGQHSAEVLREAGYEPAEIDHLRGLGVVC
ncbi:MAG TPA: CoA transferase [Acetobacteraceae bacterium]|nr:CoA transferase [Acetobacteraceae bacterium]